MSKPSLSELPQMLWRAERAMRYGRSRAIPGLDFARFGRRLALRIAVGGRPQLGVRTWLTPVNIVRYFELDFALAHLPPQAAVCIDVASPRLFSLFVASHDRARRIRILNPDPPDTALTRELAERLGLDNLSAEEQPVSVLDSEPAAQCDCLWSISVVEHIDGPRADSEAVATMARALRPGGRLILSVPVDRAFREDFRADAVYDPALTHRDPRGVFFQRVYDEARLEERLIRPSGLTPIARGWFGERHPGLFARYEEAWARLGQRVSLEDPRLIADQFRSFDSWHSMPGSGVCAVVLEKRASDVDDQ